MAEKNPLLLPSGLYDLLPPRAQMESGAVQRLLSCFESFGYTQVSPPLLEFEASLLAGRGEAMASQSFRMMDPISQAIMGFRSDMTLQVARIAATRMAQAARPLRLCYAGPILRVKPEALKNERQLMQAGIELIGTDSPHAVAEVIIVAAEALLHLNISDVSIDINLPGLLGKLCPEVKNNAALRAQVKEAIQRRDAGTLMLLPLKNGALLASLLECAGPADKALAILRSLALPQAEALAALTAQIRESCPGVTLTLDPLEYRRFDYHQGIGFSIFAAGLRHELGRGGNYLADGENAAGFTLYVTQLLGLLQAPEARKRVMVPFTMDENAGRALREDGWVTVRALTGDPAAEAQRLGIGHLWENGRIT